MKILSQKIFLLLDTYFFTKYLFGSVSQGPVTQNASDY